MRHRKLHFKLGRNATHRTAMLRNLATSLFEHEVVITTETKAKAVRGLAEHMITLAKQGNLHARRIVLRDISNKIVVKKLFEEIANRFATRPGGYTRITKLGFRRGDAAPLAMLELVDRKKIEKTKDKGKEKKEKKEKKTKGMLDTLRDRLKF